MKRLASLALSALLLPAAAFAADTYKVDPVHSCTIFRVGHASIGIVYGQFKESAGQFTLDGEENGTWFKDLDNSKGPGFLDSKNVTLDNNKD